MDATNGKESKLTSVHLIHAHGDVRCDVTSLIRQCSWRLKQPKEKIVLAYQRMQGLEGVNFGGISVDLAAQLQCVILGRSPLDDLLKRYYQLAGYCAKTNQSFEDRVYSLLENFAISEQITDVDFAVDDVEIAVEDADQAAFADLLGHAVRSVRRWGREAGVSL
jgi:hypothetical protein